MSSSQFFYLSDREKFLDTDLGLRQLMSTDEFAKHLKAAHVRYHDDALRNQLIADLREFPITTEQFKQSRTQGRREQAVNFAQLWEELRTLVPLYKRTNGNGQSQIFFVSENLEVSKVDYTDTDALVDALMHRKETFAAIREHYNTSDSLEQVRVRMSLKTFLVKMLTEFMMVDERHLLDVEPIQVSWQPEDYAYKKMDLSLLQPGPTPTWDEFTSRLDYPAVFQAWVWSIFEPTNNIRQVLWLKGAGNDGKSSLQTAI